MNTLTYKGYVAYVEYSDVDEEFFGSIINTSREEIVFGGKTVEELKKHMQEAVNGHVENCKELGVEPEKPYSGRITFRTSRELHARLAKVALASGKRSINAWMNEVLEKETHAVA